MRDLAVDLNESFSGLIFDCDGTLVDTAPVHFAAVNGALQPLGLEMSREWYMARVGLTPAALYAEFELEMGVNLDTAGITERYSPLFLANLDKVKEISVVAGIARAYFQRVPMAVASNGRLRNVTATLSATNLLNLFDQIVTAEQVAHGKPEPDVFLEAAARMHVRPGDCIVFEDSDEGLEAARRAGMRSRDIRTTLIAR